VPSTLPLRGPEIRRLRQLKRDWPNSPYLFASQRGGRMTSSNVRRLVAKTGQFAALPFPIHPHVLRHACGYKLANDGHDTGRYNTTWGTRTLRTRCATPTWLRRDLRLLEGLGPTASSLVAGSNRRRASALLTRANSV